MLKRVAGIVYLFKILIYKIMSNSFMRTTRIYHPQVLNIGQHAMLSESCAHHISSVLRFKQDDEFILFDGQAHEYLVKITKIMKKQVEVHVLNSERICRESPLKIHLAQGIAKGDHWTYSLQKAVELGVDEITPLWTQHVAYKWDKKIDEKKLDQWQAIIISACEQSGRTHIPRLHPISSFEAFMKTCSSGNRMILHPGQISHWKEMRWDNQQPTATILVGPEGGFSGEEYDLSLRSGFQSLTLGPRILRTETAVVSALSLLQALYGDL